MASTSTFKIFIILLICVIAATSSNEERKVYIVYMGHHVAGASLSHFDMLQSIVDRRFLAQQSLVRSYTRSFNGFAANLTAGEREACITYKLQTTRSWDFMGFPENVRRSPTVESDMIIGVIDSGIWPESESFRDDGFGPPPKKWKGACKGGINFTCNNKLIGAVSYSSDPNETARDTIGHGSHTASIAAGNVVRDASLYAIAKGTARGGVPLARIAAYKVCPEFICYSDQILAAFDDAIADGVDIISISIGGFPSNLEEDVIAIGSLHASENGVLVVQSAGNDVQKSTVSGVAPWIFSVAASSTDRGILTKVVLGDGNVLMGKTINTFNLNRTSFPLIYGKEASTKCNEGDAMNCQSTCLDTTLVEGNIVLCNGSDGVDEANRVGAIGSIVSMGLYSNQFPVTDISSVVPLPASTLQQRDLDSVKRYFGSTRYPTVDILKSETLKNLDAPMVAGFSSKGPNTIFPDILKPDVTAPGIEILAAFSPRASPSGNAEDVRSVTYNFLSGTSMSCPHVSGAASYVKSFHPDWSPSAIKSALMTTAWRMEPSRNSPFNSLAEFAYGAGHIDPVKAVDPGLVYETFSEDYIRMLCSFGYNSSTVQMMFGGNTTCPSGAQTSPKDLNYPSMTSHIEKSQNKSATFSRKFRRTVTNVGPGKSRYTLTTSTSPYYNITVKPSVLKFKSVGLKRSYNVIINGELHDGKMVSAWLEWSDGIRKVRSPIVVYGDSI